MKLANERKGNSNKSKYRVDPGGEPIGRLITGVHAHEQSPRNTTVSSPSGDKENTRILKSFASISDDCVERSQD